MGARQNVPPKTPASFPRRRLAEPQPRPLPREHGISPGWNVLRRQQTIHQPSRRRRRIPSCRRRSATCGACGLLILGQECHRRRVIPGHASTRGPELPKITIGRGEAAHGVDDDLHLHTARARAAIASTKRRVTSALMNLVRLQIDAVLRGMNGR